MAVSWEQLKERQQDITQQLLNGSLESSKRNVLQKELSRLTHLLDGHAELVTIAQEIEKTKAQATDNKDQELAPLFEEEITHLVQQQSQKQQELDDYMFPPDERDDRSVFLEIRAGTGGQEAALFASNLATMYTNYGLKKHWKVSVEGLSSTDLGGCREVILHIQGKGVYGHFKT